MPRRNNFTITLVAIIGAGIATALGLLLVTDLRLGSGDSSALVKGRQETGYPFVGYLISDRSRVCAGTLLDETTVLSAGHCLNYEAGTKFNFGTGEFTTSERKLTPVELVKFAPGYDPNTDEGPDLALAILSKPIKLSKYPKLTTPLEKCDASIVAYGAGLHDQKASVDMFKKKAGEGCVKGVTSSFLIRFNEGVGMCFGDSGGPIFFSPGSDELIGVLTSGLIETDLKTIKCDPGNTGLAMNLAYFSEFITSRGSGSESEAEVRVLEATAIENLSQDLQEFLSSSSAAETSSNTSSPNTDNNNNSWQTSLILAIIASLTIGLIFIASRVSNVF